METEQLPLIVIAGPTASGKTSLGTRLAQKFNGEIVCADSRTVYKGMDIGTAKPTPHEQALVPHWGLDLVEPSERFTAADFQEYANEKLREVRARGKVPFLIGGTGLYLDGVVFDYGFGSHVDKDKRAELEKSTIEALHEYCYDHNIDLPENRMNKRYIIRAIEQNGTNTTRNTRPTKNTIIVGIATDKRILKTRILERSEQLFQSGVVDEAIKLGKKYGWENEAMTGNIYQLVPEYIKNRKTLLETQNEFARLDWQLAKRQLTWLRRNPYITWRSLPEAEHYLSDILAHVESS